MCRNRIPTTTESTSLWLHIPIVIMPLSIYVSTHHLIILFPFQHLLLFCFQHQPTSFPVDVCRLCDQKKGCYRQERLENQLAFGSQYLSIDFYHGSCRMLGRRCCYLLLDVQSRCSNQSQQTWIDPANLEILISIEQGRMTH